MQLTQLDRYCRFQFPAMASLCELLLDEVSPSQALALGELARVETQRIEAKFSRYRRDNIIFQINTAQGQPVTLDEETANLMDFAAQLHALSEGRFDITSGLLRQAWKFDGSDRLPTADQIDALLPHIGWHKVHWRRPILQLQPGMEIDLGGIAKEYAVDKVFALLAEKQLLEQHSGAFLVNFGGDLRAHGPRKDGSAWQIGIEPVSGNNEPRNIELTEGALATSGDSKRFLLKDGVRYGHVLDPRTGWPVMDAHHSVTVLAPTCVQAGVFSTFALLMGKEANAFLDQQGVRYWLED